MIGLLNGRCPMSELAGSSRGRRGRSHAEVLDHLLAKDLNKLNVTVQLHGWTGGRLRLEQVVVKRGYRLPTD